MSLYADLEEFVQARSLHGELTWWTTPPTAKGYEVQVACPCGGIFQRLVLPVDAEEDLLAETHQKARRRSEEPA